MRKLKIFLVFTWIVFLTSVSMANATIIKNSSYQQIDSPSNQKVFLNPSDGYTLFAPIRSTTTYLINNDGEVVHSWESNYEPGQSVYLLENGNLLRTASEGNQFFRAGGAGGRVQEIDWDGTILWEFEYSTDQYCLHHDVEILPNGNILMIAWEDKTRAEAIAAGRNPDNVQAGGLWPDHIIEVEPIGSSGGNIVWEWHVWDHLIQDYDPTKENYGVVADHPELIDINFGRRQADWNHINSIEYNEEFDQILLSSHTQNEIWVIDHSTTTEEAAGHTGGRYGKGGDLLYRWGNPQVYRAGNVGDQKFFEQHDAQWIESGCPGEGNILVFNNGQRRPDGQYSSVDELVPPVDNNGNYSLTPGSAYGPEEPVWIYTAENPTDFYSPHISGAQRLPNGNTLICSGDDGIFFEVTPEKEIVWEYLNPFPNSQQNNVFKVCRYASDYPGLSDLFDNQAPEKPTTPSGSTSGETGTEYTYTSSTTDPDGDELYYWFNWDDGTNSEWIGPYSSGEEVSASHIWSEKGNYEIKVKAKDEYDAESAWSDPLGVIIGVPDTTSPEVEITKPLEGVYIFNRKIIPLPGIIIIGPITITADAYDEESGMDKVEFHCDEGLKHSDDTPPYEWRWDESVFGTHVINVIAYDKAGNMGTDEKGVIIFNI